MSGPRFDRYAGQLSLLKAQVDSGECPRGHDIRDKINRRRRSGREYCNQCLPPITRRTDSGLCDNGLHPRVVGDRACRACRADREPITFKLIGAPSLEVLDGAACRPHEARLFDAMERGENGKPEALDRIEQAKAICWSCPVQAECMADAVKWRRIGVFGGEYLSTSWYAKMSAISRLREVSEDLTNSEANGTMTA